MASEEAEKRLKAALTAKREPSALSRLPSPSIGSATAPAAEAALDSKPSEPISSEDVAMEETTSPTVTAAPLPEVCIMMIFLAKYPDRLHRAPGYLSWLRSSTMSNKLLLTKRTRSWGRRLAFLSLFYIDLLS